MKERAKWDECTWFVETFWAKQFFDDDVNFVEIRSFGKNDRKQSKPKIGNGSCRTKQWKNDENLGHSTREILIRERKHVTVTKSNDKNNRVRVRDQKSNVLVARWWRRLSWRCSISISMTKWIICRRWVMCSRLRFYHNNEFVGLNLLLRFTFDLITWNAPAEIHSRIFSMKLNKRVCECVDCKFGIPW